MRPNSQFISHTIRSAKDARRSLQGHRGAVLIVTLIIMAIIALALGSYLSLNLGTSRLSRKSYQQATAFHLAEAGAEEAVWSFNRAAAQSADAWDGWTSASPAAWNKFSGFDLGGNTKGMVKVYVSNISPPAGESPTVVAMSTVESPGAGVATRMLELTLGRRSYFGNGLVAKETVRFAGMNPTVDSWNSDPDDDPSTLPIAYGPSVRYDHGSVATMSAQSGAMFINEAAIWGYVATGGASPDVGAHGSIRGANTAANVAIDPSRVYADFVADLPSISAPLDGTLITSVGTTLGTIGESTRWRLPSLDLHGNQTLTILGDVTLVIISGVSVTGNASIIVPARSRLTVYIEGDMLIAGNGLSNQNVQPATCQFWGTSTSISGQKMDVSGNGALKAIIYAPNANVKINGNGDVMGAVVARNIVLTGNANFHYDEALGKYGVNTPFKVTRWRELSDAAERSRWGSVFSGW